MRNIGKRVEASSGLRWPTEAEIRRTNEFSRGVVYRHKKGVVRYRNHNEANEDMQEIVANAMARKSLEMARGE